ncbi:hypothetical protein [Zoogloea sp.]|uniref:hypothetical protein n=1 Tax=Zoogloea sp. TaxID=49181 RepID=UPI0035ADCACC
MQSNAASILHKKLAELADRIEGMPNETKFSDHWGWQAPPLGKIDLSYMASSLADRIRSVDWSLATETEEIFSDLSAKVEWLTQNTIPNLWSGPQAAEAVVCFLTCLDAQISALISPEQIRSSLFLPAALKKYVTAANLRLEHATKSIDGIEAKVAAINAAFDTAERLPSTHAELAIALAEVDKAAKGAEKLNAKSAATSDTLDALKIRLETTESEAQATLSKVREAYRAATSQGLAQAFSDKSKSLNKSMLVWVLVLLGALVVAGLLSHDRFPEILKALDGRPDWGLVLLRLALGALTIAPAVWVAWVATKQIGQRFRLAEDYAYKAALSTAYEGYRAEASRLDPLFEAQLFATALGRLDELPLRLVERDVHGSPWHELVSSAEFKSAVENFPDLKEKISSIFRNRKPISPPAAEGVARDAMKPDA